MLSFVVVIIAMIIAMIIVFITEQWWTCVFYRFNFQKISIMILGISPSPNVILNYNIILKFCTEYACITVILREIFQNDLKTEIDALDEKSFARFDFNTSRPRQHICHFLEWKYLNFD